MLNLPKSLEKLSYEWEGGALSYTRSSEWERPLSDSLIRILLDKSCRYSLEDIVKGLWAKNPALQICTEG
jgi:hypothetical protein